VLGTLTDRDITIRVCSEDRQASAIKAADVMTREAVACRPDDDIRIAEKLMGQHHKSRILVTDGQGVICGIISLSDIVDREDPPQAVKTMRAVASREARAY
jgi:CBS domain-containing protein